ncbi:MAG: helix-turn-helix transcriptional regulator [Pseudomonadota bacterium]
MITESDMDRTFAALSHQSRREMLDHLRAQPGMTVGALAAKFDVSRIAVMNHLKVLEEAGLIISEKDGRSRRLYLNAVPIQAIYERWTDTFSAHWLDRLSLIKSVAEAAARKKDPEQ